MIDDSIIDDLIHGHARGEAEQLEAAIRHRALIYQAAKKAAARPGGRDPRNIVLAHDHFPPEVW